MSGYTPVFDSVFTGTLCGKWPDTGLWVCLLAMADKNGVVDKTPQYISAVVGIGLDDLVACLERFMQPDPHSRSGDEQGRRLTRLDPGRAWGWKIVNHEKYREKARLQAKSAREVETGTNADRMRDRRGPPLTAGDPLSNANTDSNTNEEEEKSARARPATHLPDDFRLTDERRRVATTEGIDPDRTFAKFCNYWRAASGQRARKRNWDAAWRYWCQNDKGDRNAPKKTTWRPPPDEEVTDAAR